MRGRLLLIAIAAAFGIAGCVSTNATRLNVAAPTHPATKPDEVVIYRTADAVPGKYEEIALLHSTGESRWTTEQGMYKSMRKKAAALGANGIILDSLSEPGAGAKVAAAIFGVGGAQRKGKAIAIYVHPMEEPK